MWCQNNIRLPVDISDRYTLYWVWDWPKAPTQGFPGGGTGGLHKLHGYHSCINSSAGSDVLRERARAELCKNRNAIVGRGTYEELNHVWIILFCSCLRLVISRIYERTAASGPSRQATLLSFFTCELWQTLHRSGMGLCAICWSTHSGFTLLDWKDTQSPTRKQIRDSPGVHDLSALPFDWLILDIE